MKMTILVTFCLIGAAFANPSSESDSSESTSEDETSEESDSHSLEDRATSSAETRDDSLASEENIRKSWMRVFARVTKVLSAEDNSSIEAQDESDNLSTFDTFTSTGAHSNKNLSLGETPDIRDNSDTSDSDSTDTSDLTGTVDATKSSDSTSSESSETSDSSDTSDVTAKDCLKVDSTECESEEYFFENIGDDAHYSVDDQMVPDEDHRELSLRR
ncbi:secretory calcium-binding phosphoprotein 1 [Lampris incognitus]|uniref:secretory calcium-binding phosphoprotein 1 n=1 Tax=Lampris incognitus TaxID=2546036 RepID=UPI0024B61A4A|nr:secretory calcium-binding phosphoprotein 1 [Lampris incognitus]